MGWLLCLASAEVGMLVVLLAVSPQLRIAAVPTPRSLTAATNFYDSLIRLLKLTLLCFKSLFVNPGLLFNLAD